MNFKCNRNICPMDASGQLYVHPQWTPHPRGINVLKCYEINFRNCDNFHTLIFSDSGIFSIQEFAKPRYFIGLYMIGILLYTNEKLSL